MADRKMSVANKKKSGRKGKGKDAKSDDETDRENAFAFKIIDEAQTKELCELDVEEVEKKIAEILKFSNHTIDLLEATQLDYYVSALWWAKTQGYSVQQISAFFTACHNLLMNIKEKHMHILDNLNELKEMMAGVGQSECDSPGGLDCFDASQAREIAIYFHSSLFQHYKLYQFVFSHTQAEEVIGLDLTCELVLPADIPYPAPLDEGLPHEVWEKYVKTPPPTPLPETQSEQDLRAATEAEQARREARLQQEADLAEENALLTKLTPEEIKQVVEIVTRDTFKNLNAEMAAKLRERENTILNRINKVHKVASTT